MHITIDVPDRYVEVVEMYRSIETGSAFIQIVLVKEIVTRTNHRQNPQYLYREQMTSGTLAFAVGTGRVVVSTPYWAAEELLAEDRGKLVAFGDSEQMASSINELLDDFSALRRMQLRAYQYGRMMTWPRVGEAYWNLMTRKSQPESVVTETIAPARYPGIGKFQSVVSIGADADRSMVLTDSNKEK